MLKKLDILVIRAFIGPFVATFFITLLVLIMQFFWLWVDDFVGKGISVNVLLEFIWYQSAVLVPLALPLAVLLSSIMTFGNMGESYELVAIKAAGISLLRFMRPLFIVAVFIAAIAFSFSNYIIPVATLKSRTLLGDIVNANPSFDLKEGVFYDKIPSFAIKVGKKENDSVIRDVIIYEQTNAIRDNFIIASSGVMRASDNKRFLEFNLRDGWRYEERGNGENTELIRLGFKEYKRQFDISTFGLQQRTADSANRGNQRMMNMRQLNRAIDSLNGVVNSIGRRIERESFGGISNFSSWLDSNWKTEGKPRVVNTFSELVPDSIRTSVRQRAANRVSNMRISNDIIAVDHKAQQKYLRQHLIEWHRKITLSAACIVLFLIGAPLGSIIRKGGLGSPLIFAIVFFMFFYFSSSTGEKNAKEGTLEPWFGMWLSTFVLLPIGLFLIYKAMRDSQLFNKELWTRLWGKISLRRKA
ncbi:MAG TPA: LptF/LptG family permease [Flavisolibacter sp.]|nr:LptF/LptG family permease [Flavisolibacter sp.]